MRLSTRSRYGILALMDLAVHASDGPVMVREIAEREGLSERYLEQLLLSLKTAGMVRATRGSGGGFTLARPPAEINIREVIRITEGSTAFTECADDPAVCSRSSSCALLDAWIEVTKAAEKVMESITIKDLIERQARKPQMNSGLGCPIPSKGVSQSNESQ